MERGQNRLWALIEQREAFRPACGNIGEAEGIEGAALTIPTIVGNQIGFQKTRLRVVPVVEGPNGMWCLSSGLAWVAQSPRGPDGRCERLLRWCSWQAGGFGFPRLVGDIHAVPMPPQAWVKMGSSVWRRYIQKQDEACGDLAANVPADGGKRARILPAGKISREVMRTYHS